MAIISQNTFTIRRLPEVTVNSATIYLYKRISSNPGAAPASLQYDFGTGALTGNLGTWTRNIPAGTTPLWVIGKTVISSSATVTISSSDWTTPVKMAENGTDGSNGVNSTIVRIYRRAARGSNPTTIKPTGSTVWKFSTGAFTTQPNNGWSLQVPPSNEHRDPLWTTHAMAIATAPADTATILASGWATPTIMAEDGAKFDDVNLINNGNFAFDAWDWALPGNILSEYTSGVETRYVKVAYNWNFKKDSLEIPAGRYSLRIKVRNTSGSSQPFRVDHGGTRVLVTVPHSTAWQVLTAPVEYPGAQSGIFYLLINGGSASIDLAEISMVRGDVAPQSFQQSQDDLLRYIATRTVGGENITTHTQIKTGAISANYSYSVISAQEGEAQLKRGRTYTLSIGSSANTKTFTPHSYTVRVYDAIGNTTASETLIEYAGTARTWQFTTPTDRDVVLLLYHGTAHLTAGGNATYNNILLQEGEIGTSFIEPVGYLRKALQSGEVESEGALFLAGIIAARSQGGDVTAYMNGYTGKARSNDEDDAVAFAAGVKKFGTIDETRNIEFRHGGSAKVGIFEIDSTGVITMKNLSGQERLLFNPGSVPTADMINAGSSFSGNLNLSAGSTTTQQVLTGGSTNVTRQGATATFSEIRITLIAEGYAASGGVPSTATATLYMRVGGVRKHQLGSVSLSFSLGDGGLKSETLTVAGHTRTLFDTGFHSFELVVEKSGAISTAQAQSIAFSFGWEYNLQGVRRFEFGANGFMSWFDNNAIHFDEDNGLYGKGKVNLPGAGLGGFSVGSNGAVISNSWWGKVAGGDKISKSGVSFTVTHNIGNTNYAVMITPMSENAPYFTNKNANNVVITCPGGFDCVFIRTK